MKFQILSAGNFVQLNQLEQVHSHLALGPFYAKAGLITEAGRELQIVVSQNRLLNRQGNW